MAAIWVASSKYYLAPDFLTLDNRLTIYASWLGSCRKLATVWVIPVIIAITFHEAAHGFVARLLGDDTAWWLGPVSEAH
jgi:hypothetical protein